MIMKQAMPMQKIFLGQFRYIFSVFCFLSSSWSPSHHYEQLVCTLLLQVHVKSHLDITPLPQNKNPCWEPIRIVQRQQNIRQPWFFAFFLTVQLPSRISYLAKHTRFCKNFIFLTIFLYNLNTIFLLVQISFVTFIYFFWCQIIDK